MTKRYTLPLLCLAFAWLNSVQLLATTPFIIKGKSAKAYDYADSVLGTLTLEEQLAQLIMPMVYPKGDPTSVAEWNKMVARGYGGVLWQKGKPEVQLMLTNKMRERARIPLMVAMDGEWGLSMRLSGTIQWPRNIVIGASNSTELARQYGQATASEAKRMGIHVNFAPVLDVNSNPLNPVIGTRSFGSNPNKVIELGLAYAKGLEANGVLSCAKHFPGHGDTDKDSHYTLPLVAKRRAELEQVELKPFRAYTEAELGAVMVGHLNVPAFDDSGRASSASHKVVAELLKGDLGFEGLIFTDGLAMEGILAGSGGSRVAVEVFKAENDILLAPKEPEVALQELLRAVERGEIKEEEVRTRCRKVLAWKYALGVVTERSPLPLTHLYEELNSNRAKELRQKLYEHSVTLVQHRSAILPIGKGKRIALLRYGNSRTPHLLHTLQEGVEGVKAFSVSSKSGASARSTIYEQLQEYPVVVVAITSATMKADEGLLALAKKGNVILTFLTSPYAALNYQEVARNAKAVAFGYENSSTAQEVMGKALMGKIPFRGVLPVQLTPLYDEGTAVELSTKQSATLPQGIASKHFNTAVLGKIDEVAQEGVDKGAYPGCQVLVAKEGEVVYHKAFGYKDSKKKEPNSTQTLYDLASVTKATVTTPLIMMAVDEGWLHTSHNLGKHIPYLRGSNKEQVKISDLLFHTGGLPAIIRFYTLLIDEESYQPPLLSYKPRAEYPTQIAHDAWARDTFQYLSSLVQPDSSALYPIRFAEGLYLSEQVRELMRQEIKECNLRPGRYRYSDIDFLLLQEILELHYQKPIDMLFSERIAQPLGLDRLTYNPLRHFTADEIAEGQYDNFLRHQTLRGDVDDEAAAMLGGVSGNAGLYGNAEQLAVLLQMLLNKGFYDGERYIKASTVERFTTARHRTSPYALGFDRHRGKNKKGNTASEAPLSTYGHTGFTGTCFWIDPKNELIYIFLSNRGTPIRWNKKLSQLNIRTRIQSIIYQALR